MSGYVSGDRPGDEDPWRPPQDAGPGQQPQGPGRPEHGQQPPQYGESPGPPPYPEPSTPQYPSPPPYGYSYPSDAQPAEPAPMPSTVHWASIAIIAGSALTLIGAIITIARLDSVVDEIVRTSEPVVDREAARAGVVIFTGVAIVIALLFILLASQVRRGKNWARIVVIIVGGVVILLGLFSLGSGGGGGLLDVLGLLLMIVTVALLLRRPSNEYFRAASRPR